MPEERNPQRGSALYADAIAQRLSREIDRKTSLESRAVTILTTSGLLATVLLGLATLTKQTSAAHFSLPHASHGSVIAALILFTIAAAGAIVTNSPFWYEDANPEHLQELLDEGWDDPPDEAEKAVALLHVTAFKSIFRWNQIKGRALFLATICEALAIGCVAYAVWVSL